MTTIVFPGQGSQSLGMSRDFYENFQMARETFELIEDVSKIGIATSDKFGNTSITRIKFKNKNKVIFY